MTSETPDLERGQWAAVLVQYLEDRDRRALVRLPNGSKTSIAPTDLHRTIVRFHVADTPAAEIVPGDIYEDCSYHPVLCTYNDGDEIGGISLIDGSQPRGCSIGHCGVVKLEIADALEVVERLRGSAPRGGV